MSISKVWQKDNIPRGDLQLLKTSRSSGVLRLTRSNYPIDHITYFRNEAFSNLDWQPVNGKEMASALFKLVINGEDKGIFELEISYKLSWESDQGNYTTGLHWGDASSIVRDETLIGRTLILYKANNEIFDYQIDIS